MTLTSFNFLLFFASLFFLYYIIPKKLQWVLLLGANILFYLSAGLKPAVFIAFTTVTIYVGALLIANMAQKQRLLANNAGELSSKEIRAHNAKKLEREKRLVLIAVIVLNLGILAFLKYFNFFAENVNQLFAFVGVLAKLPTFKLFLPLGISFYTFQAVGYLIDVSREVCEPQRNFAKFALYCSYFPSVMQGPINRYNDLSPQLFQPHHFNYTQVTFGMQRMLWGFFKKLVIADRLALFVNQVYGNWQDYTGFQFVIAAIFFTFQLYTDFSGCMDIVIGASQVLGIRLPENFQTPFFSKSISEFWRRWHITLGAWFKDYMFYPMLKSNFFQKMTDTNKKRFGKKLAKALTTYAGLFILWFVMGLWHGASWKFIIGTGLLHWFYVVSGEVCAPIFKKTIAFFKINTDCFSWRLFQSLRTFCLVTLGFVFFRADGFMTALRICKRTLLNFNPWVFFDGTLLTMGLDGKDFTVAVIALLILLVVSILQQKIHIREKLAEQNLVFRWAILYILFFTVIIFGIYGPGYDATEFIYRQF